MSLLSITVSPACVRRSFLCGYHKSTRKNYDHRQSWIEHHLLLLAEVSLIENAGYSIMSNHFHVELHVDKAKADNLTDDEVIQCWLKRFRGFLLPSSSTWRYWTGRQLRKGKRGQIDQNAPSISIIKSAGFHCREMDQDANAKDYVDAKSPG